MRLFSSVPVGGFRVGLSVPIGRRGRQIMPWPDLVGVLAIAFGAAVVTRAIFGT